VWANITMHFVESFPHDGEKFMVLTMANRF
jgi:hypothetical protein